MVHKEKSRFKVYCYLFIIVGLLLIFAWSFWTLSNRSTEVRLSEILHAPSVNAWFGRDELGRDVFSRVLVGGARTLFPSLFALLLVATIGLTIGIMGVCLGGIVNQFIQIIISIFQAFPPVILVISLVGFLGLGLEQTILAICLTSWTKYAYLMQNLLLDVHNDTYFRFASMLGNNFKKKVRLYYIPTILPELLTTMAYDVNTIIMEIAGLSFIGLGTPLPNAEWGSMISAGRTYLQTAPWIVIFPSFFLIMFIGILVFFTNELKRYFVI